MNLLGPCIVSVIVYASPLPARQMIASFVLLGDCLLACQSSFRRAGESREADAVGARQCTGMAGAVPART